MSGASGEALARVYSAHTARELAAAYGGWAHDYDRDTISSGYHLPFTIAAFVSRHVRPGDGPLLDAGCGTGLSAPVLAALGYTAIEGLDFSPDMLALAQARGGYGRLTQAELGKPLPYEEGRFAAVFSTGVFTAGHAPASAFDELARITKRGGHVIATVRDSIFESGGFAPVFARLVAAQAWTQVERSPPFRAFLIEEPEVTVTAFVFRRK